MDGHNPNASLLAEGGGRIVAMSGGGGYADRYGYELWKTPINSSGISSGSSLVNSLGNSLGNSLSHLEGRIATIQEAIELIRRNEGVEPLISIRDGLVAANSALTAAVQNPSRLYVEDAARILDDLRRESVELRESSPPSGERRAFLQRLFGAIAVAKKWGSDFLKVPEPGSTYEGPDRNISLPNKETVTSQTNTVKTVKTVNGSYGIPDLGSDSKGFQLEDLFTLKEPIADTRARKPTYDLTKLPKEANQTLIGHLVKAIQASSLAIKVTISEPKK
jgi:hypothetical protein